MKLWWGRRAAKEGRLQASMERRGNNVAIKRRQKASKQRWNYGRGGEQSRRDTTGKQEEMVIKRSRIVRLQASKERWKYGGGGERATKKGDCRQARKNGNIEKPKNATTGKLGEMEIWWGRRAAKKGHYRQAKRGGDIEQPRREKIGKQKEKET